jgi:hypothetical protein
MSDFLKRYVQLTNRAVVAMVFSTGDEPPAGDGQIRQLLANSTDEQLEEIARWMDTDRKPRRPYEQAIKDLKRAREVHSAKKV